MVKKKTSGDDSMENVVEVIKLLAKERGISEDEIFEAIEDGIVAAFRREFAGNKQVINEVQAEIDRETGEIFVFKLVEVVDEVLDEANEISLEEAKAMDDEIELGDQIEVGIEVEGLGRLAAGAAKSSISQKLREAESRKIKAEFGGKINEISSGVILRKDARNVYVDIDRAEAVVPKEGQIKSERYDSGKIMKFLVTGVEEHNGRPSVTLSRTSPALVEKLFELEVPEIRDGEVIISSVAREAGARTKVAVFSRDPNIDAKGSCVGPRGQRVQQVMNELGGEKIDIVDWNEDPALFISEALQPAQVLRVDTEISTNEDGKTDKSAKVVVPDSQFSLAIGKSGQNVRLAAKLTGFKIDIKKESQDFVSDSDDLLGNVTVYDEEGNELSE